MPRLHIALAPILSGRGISVANVQMTLARRRSYGVHGHHNQKGISLSEDRREVCQDSQAPVHREHVGSDLIIDPDKPVQALL